MTTPPSPCGRDLDAYLRLNRALPWEWVSALRRLTGSSAFRCQAEFSNSELGNLSSLCVNEGRLIYFCTRQTFRLHTDIMRSFALILVKDGDAEPDMQREELQRVMAVAPGSSLDLLIRPGSRVALIQPEFRCGQTPISIGGCQDLFQVIDDYLFRARFFRDHKDAAIATDTFIRVLCCLMAGGGAPRPFPELDRRLMRVVAKIEEEARWDFNLGELAAYSGVSERNLYYLMKRETGLTPYRFYQRQRLIRVRRRLVDCQCEVPHISWYAADEGFTHLGRFAALYRQHFGELPSETVQWRRLLGVKPEEAAQTLAVY